MLNPIELLFAGARDFEPTRLDLTVGDFFVGGRNGSGKTTIGLVINAILGSSERVADPRTALMSTHKTFTAEEPWRFDGHILLLNDGALPDYERYIQVSAHFQGHGAGSLYKLFTIRQGLQPGEWSEELRFGTSSSVGKIGDFKEHLVRMGICPDTFRLYWAQGETNKFAHASDEERFQRFALMLGLDDQIASVRKRQSQYAEQERLLIEADRRRESAGVALQKSQLVLQAKRERDEALRRQVVGLLSVHKALVSYATREISRLEQELSTSAAGIGDKQRRLEQEKLGIADLERRMADQAKRINGLEEQARQTAEQRKEIEQQKSQYEQFLDDKRDAYERVVHYLTQLAGRDLADLQRQVDQIQHQHARQSEKLANMRRERETAIEDQRQLAQKVDEISQACEQLIRQIQEATATLSVLGTNVAEQEAEFEKHHNSLSLARAQREAADAAYRGWLLHFHGLRNGAQRWQRSLASQAEPVRIQHKAANEQAERLRKEVGGKQADLDYLRRKLSTEFEPADVLRTRLAEAEVLLDQHREAETMAIRAVDDERLRLSRIYSQVIRYREQYTSLHSRAEHDLADVRSTLRSQEDKLKELAGEKGTLLRRVQSIGRSPEQIQAGLEAARGRQETERANIRSGESRQKVITEALQALQLGHKHDHAQERMLNANAASFKAWRFADVFEVDTGHPLQDEREEDRIGVLKYAVLIYGDEPVVDDLHPHVPLLRYEPRNASCLPPGLKVRAGIPEDVCSRAVAWLTSAMSSEHVTVASNGQIADVTGLRNYPANQQERFLNSSARARKVQQLKQEQGDLAGHLDDWRKGLAAAVEQEQKALEDLHILRDCNERISQIDADVLRVTADVAEVRELLRLTETDLKDLAACLALIEPAYAQVLMHQRDVQDMPAQGGRVSIDRLRLEMDIAPSIQAFVESMQAQRRATERVGDSELATGQIRERLATVMSLQDQITHALAELQNLEAELAASDKRCSELLTELQRLQSLVRTCNQVFEAIEKIRPESAPAGTELPAFHLDQLQELAEKLSDDFSSLGQAQDRKSQLAKQEEGLVCIVGEVEHRLALCRKAEATLARQNEHMEMTRSLSDFGAKLEDTKNLAQQLIGKLDLLEGELKELEQKRDDLERLVQRGHELDLSIKRKYEDAKRSVDDCNRDMNRLYEAADRLREQLNPLYDDRRSAQDALNQKGQTCQALQEEIGKLQERGESLSKRRDEWHQNLSVRRVSLDLVRAGRDTNFSLPDMLCLPEQCYTEHFAVYPHVPEWLAYVEGLTVPNAAEPADDRQFDMLRARAIHGVQEIVRILTNRNGVDEEIEEKHRQAVGAVEMAEAEYRDFSRERDRSMGIFHEQRQLLETAIKTHEANVNRHLTWAINQFGLSARIHYVIEEREERGDVRRLRLEFSKGLAFAFSRYITGPQQLSGGEEAIVSLMLAYAIMKSKAEDYQKKVGKALQGGFILLDEWDAHLDALNAETVFTILKNLGRKIISISPRSTSERFERYFTGIAKVVSDARRNVSCVYALASTEERRQYFDEAKRWELQDARPEVAATSETSSGIEDADSQKREDEDVQ